MLQTEEYLPLLLPRIAEDYSVRAIRETSLVWLVRGDGSGSRPGSRYSAELILAVRAESRGIERSLGMYADVCAESDLHLMTSRCTFLWRSPMLKRVCASRLWPFGSQ